MYPRERIISGFHRCQRCITPCSFILQRQLPPNWLRVHDSNMCETAYETALGPDSSLTRNIVDPYIINLNKSQAVIFLLPRKQPNSDHSLAASYEPNRHESSAHRAVFIGCSFEQISLVPTLYHP